MEYTKYYMFISNSGRTCIGRDSDDDVIVPIFQHTGVRSTSRAQISMGTWVREFQMEMPLYKSTTRLILLTRETCSIIEDMAVDVDVDVDVDDILKNNDEISQSKSCFDNRLRFAKGTKSKRQRTIKKKQLRKRKSRRYK
jgi:hypothetical protein